MSRLKVPAKGDVKLFSSKRQMVAAGALLLLALFLLRPGASRLKSRIVSSISSAVGRPVDIGSVHIRLLPRPGFDLENLVVYDDPAFGAEPMLRATEVMAALRLTSLVRGRLEISRLELTEPSLNLVHSLEGRWNAEALLERSAQIPLAPTGKAKTERRQGFPYIQATSARINFKNGAEKKPYALTNADFSLWQDSENTWGVRLKAQPFRSDLNLNDTGLLQVSGSWQRASTSRETPLQLSIEWNRAQLGQFTKFFTGSDQGWRGEILLDVAVTGTPTKLHVTSNASVQDFRRYDIVGGEALRLAAHCEAEYSSLTHIFHQVACGAPVGSGVITLIGDVGLPGSHNYGLVLTAENVPASAAAVMAKRAKKNLPDDLAAEGTVRGSLSIEGNSGSTSKVRFEGRGEISDLHLTSVADKTEIGPETIPFHFTTGDLRRQASHKSVAAVGIPDGPHLEFGPFPAGIGRAGATSARGWVNREGYSISVLGEAEVTKALRVARMFGVAAPQSATEGTAQIDLQIAGSWAGRNNAAASGFAGPQVTGKAKLRNVRLTVRGVGGPVEIDSADMQLLADEVRVANLSAEAAGASWTGSLEMPRGCGTPGACEVHFILNADQIALNDMSDWASPYPKERPWYRILEPRAQSGPSFLASLRASGKLSADLLKVQGVSAMRVSASVKLDSGKLQISDLDADFLGGKHRGEWIADFRVKPATCGGKGNMTGVSLARLAESMNDSWIAGAANARYEVKGSCQPEFWKSADGTLQFDVRDGMLTHILLGDRVELIKVKHFAGLARLQSGEFELQGAELDSQEDKFQVSGTASLGRQLDLKLSRTKNGAAAVGYTITGTLAEPRVVPSAGHETQARLKP